MNNDKSPKDTATTRSNGINGGGHDGRRGVRNDTSTTFTTAARAGVNFPNEDVGNTLTREQYLRDGR